MTSDENPADAIEPWFPLHDDDPSIGNGDRWTPCVETPGACPTLSIWFATEQQCEQWITAHLLADPADRDAENEAFTWRERALHWKADKERAEAERDHAKEVAELAEKDRRTYHQDAIRAQAEVAELREKVDRVRALVDDRDALPRLPIGRGKSVFVSTAEVRAALDGGEQS